MLINKKNVIYLLLSFSIFLGYFLEENSSGGAKLDHQYLLPFIENFKIYGDTVSYLEHAGPIKQNEIAI